MFALPVACGPFVPATLAPKNICPLEPAVDEPELVSTVPKDTSGLLDEPEETKMFPATARVLDVFTPVTDMVPAEVRLTEPEIFCKLDVVIEPLMLIDPFKLTAMTLPP